MFLTPAKIWHSIKSAWKRHNKASLPFYNGETSEHPNHRVIEEVQTPGGLATATNNFHLSNKLRQGGFGPVYKGKLQDGEEIAVKKLSRTRGQGLEEFINEVVVISKLQHGNLVRLLGCCVEGDEKMLIYEYLAKQKLEYPSKSKLLDWRKRCNIIEGIAGGLLYLESLEGVKIKLILTGLLKPCKYAFFRLCLENMPWKNSFSEKISVLVLEIVSERKNSNFYDEEPRYLNIFMQGNLGWAYMQKMNYMMAEVGYRKAQMIDPDCNLGLCLIKQVRYEEAHLILEDVLKGKLSGSDDSKSRKRAQDL
ncbi:G-type lectin S-receptor-like serine/threonine-protein kinase, partial [Mucuna pruriens]